MPAKEWSMNAELEQIAHNLSNAVRPEDVFGKLDESGTDPLPALRRIYRSLVKATHPDVYHSTDEWLLAQTAFRQLIEWFAKAEEKVKTGRYGHKETMILKTSRRYYEIEIDFKEDRLFNHYPCGFREQGKEFGATLRMTRDPKDNDLAGNEIRALQLLQASKVSSKYSPYFPDLIDAFIYDDGKVLRQASVFEKYEGWYSLQDVHRRYPDGIDPRDMAWMWRRVLTALGFAHTNSVIHGAVLPPNLWIQPEQHGVMLANWFRAVRAETGELISSTDPDFNAWYPQEVHNHEAPTFGTDISMSAKLMIHLLGGDAERNSIPDSIPHALRMFLKGSVLPGKRAPQDAWALLQEFDDLLYKLWGERKFHPFTMN
jgi:serine/threonine protein kinase